MKNNLIALAALAIAAALPISAPAGPSTLQRFCIPDKLLVPPFDKSIPVPVGCEVIDCCPGCPGPGPLDWKIDVESRLIDSVELRFKGLAAADVKRLKVTGQAKLVNSGIVLGKGASTISGLPPGTSGKAVVAALSSKLNKGAAAKLRASAGDRDTDKDSDGKPIADGITIKQLLGGYEVNRLDIRYLWQICFPPPVLVSDRLKVTNIAAADNTVVMMDSRTAAGAAGCTDDEVMRSTGNRTLSNRLASAGCNSEIAIFATANAMQFDTPVGTWTNNVGDLHTSNLAPIISMPISVWITNNAAAAQAANDVANANLLYSINKIGVQFVPTYNNVSGNAGAVATIGNASCGAVGAIQGSAWYSANVLNAYYVNGAFTGENCARTLPVGDGNISYMGTLANLASLAHEIGHAFGLRPAGSGGHTNGLAGFANNNIMWGGGPPGRDEFTLGQAFRMNTHTDAWGGTMLITDGLRAGPPRACPPLTTSATCPALGLNWARP